MRLEVKKAAWPYASRAARCKHGLGSLRSDGRMVGWMDGRMDGWSDEEKFIIYSKRLSIILNTKIRLLEASRQHAQGLAGKAYAQGLAGQLPTT